jgi:carbon-monoxide dehydrogenase large subunit
MRTAMSVGVTKYIGKRVVRREDRRFLTGRGRYVGDVALPRTLGAAFLRSPHAHAVVKAVRAERAAAHPGVLAVLTPQEAARGAHPIVGDLLLPGWKSSAFPILAWPRVRFAGEAVVAVAAVDAYVARDATDLVEVEYEPLPPITDVTKAVEPGSPLLRPEWGDNWYLERQIKAGDVEGAFAAADLVWERTFRTHRYAAFPLETRGCMADYDPVNEFLTFYSSSQIPHLLRTQLAATLGLLEHSVRVVAPDVGGGFGLKAHLFPEEVAVCLLSMRLGRPVKWIEDAREHLLASNHAHEHVHHIQVAVKKDGTILGAKTDILVDCGAYSSWPESAAAEATQAARVLPGGYKIRNYESRTRAVATNKCPIGAYRGVGRPSATFTMERAIEDIARRLGLDPMEIRLQNYIQDDEYPYTTVTDLVYDSASMVGSLKKAAEAIGYREFRVAQSRARAEGRCLGVGFGSYIEQTAHTTKEYAKRGNPIVRGYDSVCVSLDPSGKVTVDSSLHSHGQGHETSFAQVVAERLGILIEDVRVRFGDTQSAPYGMGTYASRSATIGGGAAWKGAEAIRAPLLTVAAYLMEANPADLEIADGTIRVVGSPQRKTTVAEVARTVFHRPDKLPPGVMPSDFTSIQSYDVPPGTGTFANSVHAATVEVDAATGHVRILRYVVVEDCGNMINPLIVDGQLHGGAAQGIGGALLEHLIYDADGQALCQTLIEYLIPGAPEVPPIETHHLVTPSPFTLGGLKGMGEGGAIAPLATLANAVSDALAPLGVSVDALPLSPERVLRLIQSADGRH